MDLLICVSAPRKDNMLSIPIQIKTLLVLAVAG